MRVRRPEPIDALLIALVLVGQVELWVTRHGSPPISLVVLHLMSPGALLVRRRSPLTATLVTMAAEAAVIQLEQSTLSAWFLGTVVAMAVIGALPLRVAATGLLLMFGVCLEGSYLDRLGGGVGDLLMSFAFMTGAWSLGLLLGRRNAATAALARHSADLERQRDVAAAEAVAAERARVTRELHDVLAHALTVLVVQTVAARDSLAHEPSGGDLDRRLATTEQVARDALTELRLLLGVLDEGGPGAHTDLGTGLDGVRALVSQLDRTGVGVELEVIGEPRELGAALAGTVYRVTQEALTNALRHAHGARVRVEIAFAPSTVSVLVRNGPGVPGPLSSAGAGRGLLGLHERVRLYHGSMRAGPTGDGGFEISCLLPDPLDSDRGPGGPAAVHPDPEPAR